MANPTITLEASGNSSKNSATVDSGTVATLTAGDLLLVAARFNDNEDYSSIALGGTLAISGDWAVAIEHPGSTSTVPIDVVILFATYASGTGTVSVTWTKKSNARKSIVVCSIPAGEWDSGDPIVQTKSGEASEMPRPGNFGLTFDSSFDTGNSVFGALTTLQIPSAISVVTATEVVELDDTHVASFQKDESPSGTDLLWNHSLDQGRAAAWVGIEIKAAAGEEGPAAGLRTLALTGAGI